MIITQFHYYAKYNASGFIPQQIDILKYLEDWEGQEGERTECGRPRSEGKGAIHAYEMVLDSHGAAMVNS